jgi:hypothetical protein
MGLDNEGGEEVWGWSYCWLLVVMRLGMRVFENLTLKEWGSEVIRDLGRGCCS